MAAPTPTVKAFLLADSVFQQKNGKLCIVGVFDKLYATRFPVVHPSMGLYVKLADAKGSYRVRADIENSEGQQIARLDGINVTAHDRAEEGGIGIEARGLLLPAPGTYFINLYFNDAPPAGGIDIRFGVEQVAATPPARS